MIEFCTAQSPNKHLQPTATSVACGSLVASLLAAAEVIVSRHMPCAVRIATVQDADMACHVLRRSITECCVEDHKNRASVLDVWLKNKTPQNVRTWFQNPGSFPVVAEVDGKIVGVALMSRSGEIALCYLVPEARFIGAGKALLSFMEIEAARRGLGSLHLESTGVAVTANAISSGTVHSPLRAPHGARHRERQSA